MKGLRVVIELRNEGRWQLRTSDLGDFVDAFGQDLLTRFCCCYLLADRLKAIYGFMNATLLPDRVNSPGGKRDFMSLYAFAASTLKELGRKLEELRTALRQQRLGDMDLWDNGLAHWEAWARDKINSRVRNKLLAHVELQELGAGLAKVRARGGGSLIAQGHELRAAESWFPLSHYCFVEAMPLKPEEFSDVIASTANLLGASQALDEQWSCVLKQRNLAPFLCRIRGGAEK